MINSNTCHKRSPTRPPVWILALLVFVCFSNPTAALTPNKSISQYIHDRWREEQGFPGGPVNAFAQTPDGYLWIGTQKGLVRFDGLGFSLMDRVDSNGLPFGPVLGLVVDSAGNLWIRLQGPRLLLRYRDGTLRTISLDDRQLETDLTAMCSAIDGDVLLSDLTYGLLRGKGGELTPLTTRSALPRLVLSLAQMPDGKVWLGTREQGLFSFADGKVSTFPSQLPDAKINSLLAVDQDLWIGTDHGLVRWNARGLSTGSYPNSLRHLQVVALARDHDSNVWVGTSNGLMRIRPGTDWSLEGGDPHAGTAVTALFEDREGNLWIGTARGIERIRDSSFTNYSIPDAASASVGPLFVDSNLRTWFAPTDGGLFWLKDGGAVRVSSGQLRDDVVYSIDGRGSVLWVGGQSGLTRLAPAAESFSARTYTRSDGLPANAVYAVHESRDGSVWAGTLNSGVARFYHGSFTTFTTADGLPSNTIASILEASDGTMWFGTSNGLSSFSHGQWRTYSSRDGLPPGTVNCLLEDSAGTLWIGSDNGLAYMHSGTIQIPGELPDSLREQIFGIAQDQTASLWISTEKHIVRVDRGKLMHDQLGSFALREYGLDDGLLSSQGIKRYKSVVTDRLGRIWVSTPRGISFASPTSPLSASVPALVHIEALSADGHHIDFAQDLRVPAPHQRITLSYAGLSLSVPERVRFMYRLDSFDDAWTEPTSNRQAVYTNLAAGHYRFRVLASNSDGIWNSSEASIPFDIEPTFWQSWWFRMAGVLLLGLAALGVFRLRLLRLTSQMKLRFEERLAERTRIAQELHDTLLQGVISASMQLHVVADQVPPDSPAKTALDRVLALMGRVTEEGRNAVGGLRAYQNHADLSEAFSQFQKEFITQENLGFQVTVEGQPRPLHPVIQDEIYSIGREALTNAFRHAHGKKIEVELEYAHFGLRVLVRDNGVGFESDILRFGRHGHWGLSGMRERAKRIGANLRVFSRPAAGTEVELIVPAPIAFQSSPGAHSKWFSKILPSWKQILDRTPKEYPQ